MHQCIYNTTCYRTVQSCRVKYSPALHWFLWVADSILTRGGEGCSEGSVQSLIHVLQLGLEVFYQFLSHQIATVAE